jgi:hypothetical protein
MRANLSECGSGSRHYLRAEAVVDNYPVCGSRYLNMEVTDLLDDNPSLDMLFSMIIAKEQFADFFD